MPSVADLIFLVLLGALLFTPLSVRLLGDAGIGWHIRTGQQILGTHAFPRVDSFSSTMQGKPWFAWEWLYDVVVGQFEATAGVNGVVWFTALVIAVVFGWLFRLLIARRTSLCIALVLVLLAISASMIHFLSRPHVLSWLLALVWFEILDATERECYTEGSERLGRYWLWALPLLMLIWVNVHGSFPLGFGLLGIFWLGSLWTWFKAREDRIDDSLRKIAAGHRAWVLTWVGVVSAVASLINPYGWKLHAHVYSYLSNRFLMDRIEEFQSPNFHGIAQRCFLVLLLISIASLAVRGRELRLSGVLTVLFAIYAGLYAARNIPVSSLLLAMVVGPLFCVAGSSGGFFKRMTAVESGMRGHLWPIFATIGSLFIVVHGGRVGSDQLIDAHFDSRRMPVDAVNFMEHRDMRGSILSPDYWGGFLIYRLYPKMHVVVDDRHDLYGAEFLKSYLRMVHVEPGWSEFLQSHAPSCVLLPRNAALAAILTKTAGWNVIYSDEVSMVFVRDGESH
jgi:hypothetical protein